MENLKRAFRPEFLNRIDDIVVFHPLTEAELGDIANIMMNDLRKRLAEQDLTLELTDEALKELSRDGYDVEYGARPLRRTIQNKIEDPLADALLEGKYKEGDTIKVDVEEGKFVFTK